jgi:hypothetical protein
MNRVLLLVARWIAAAHDCWRESVARRSPLRGEIDFLRDALQRLRDEDDLLRARLSAARRLLVP